MSKILVTGANGCIGAWVVRGLLDRGDEVTAFDRSLERHRLEAVLDADRLDAVTFISGDVTDVDAIRNAVEHHGRDGIIHLAGLQVPACRDNPVLGASVNVLGSLAVLEAAAEFDARVVYASSAAVFGPDDEPTRPHAEHETGETRTHYGVFKIANEGNARIQFQDKGVSSVGLRPLTIYGVGRDFGMTSGPTTALKAAALGLPFKIGFTGPTDFQLVDDVAAIFIRSLDAPVGAHVFNLHGETATVEEVVTMIDRMLDDIGHEDHRGLVSCSGPHLPIPGAMDDTALINALGPPPRTSLRDGLERTYRAFLDLRDQGRLDRRDLPSETA
ncbi:MAG: epimerase [Phycisphaerae bacterium]|nr:epimerase [Phycisphaerae bacterium]